MKEVAGVEEVIGAEGVPASARGSRRMGAGVVGPMGMGPGGRILVPTQI